MVAEPLSVSISAAQVGVFLAYLLFLGLWGYAELLDCCRRWSEPHSKIEVQQELASGTSLTRGLSLGRGAGRRVYTRTHSDEPDEEAGQQKDAGAPLPASLPSPSASLGTEQKFTVASSGWTKCLLLDRQALLDSRKSLRATVEFGTILLWYYVSDRTTTFPYGLKSYSRDVLSFIFLGLTLVGLRTSLKAGKAPMLLNRQQTEEWKGWMQVLFLLYHYFNAREIYNAIRVFIAGYVWMTGFGNFLYYHKTNDFGFGRFCQMMWRLNFLVLFTCIALQNSYMLYYICPMHTLFTILVYGSLGLASKYNQTASGIWIKIALCFTVVFVCWDIKAVFYTLWGPFTFLMGYNDPRKPTDDLLHEWYFRSSLDRYVWIHGMICAYLHPSAQAALERVEKQAPRLRALIKAGIVAVALAVLAVWYNKVYVLPKVEYNKVHPYTSWIPITVWAVLRNVTPGLRTWSVALYGWLGCITLETYISQFHTWLITAIPDGQPKLLLTFFPPAYPLLNFAAATAVYVFVSHRLFVLTNTLKSVVVPNKAGPELLRNAALMAGTMAAFYAAGVLILRAIGPVVLSNGDPLLALQTT